MHQFQTGQGLTRGGISGPAASRRTGWRRVASVKVDETAMDNEFPWIEEGFVMLESIADRDGRRPAGW